MLAMRIARPVTLFALLPFLGACATTGASLQSVEAACLAEYPTYSGAWACARDKHAGSYDEYRARYVANGDALLYRVNHGQISDANAREILGRAGGRR